MRKLALSLGLGLVLAVSLMGVGFPALPDGGSLVTTAGNAGTGNPVGDGGGPTVTIDTGHTESWVPALRCSSRMGSPRSYYRFSADGGLATDAYELLDLDRTFDLPLTQPNTYKLRYLSLTGEDGGPPACYLTQPDFPGP